MLIKAFTLHSLPYVVAIASSIVAAHHVTPSMGTTLGFRSDAGNRAEMISTQVVNRSLKGSRLPIKQAVPQANVKELLKVPAEVAPNAKIKIDCRPHIDVPGRCFAGAKPDRKIAQNID